MLHQHVSKPLNGNQTISGTFKGTVGAMESSAAANFVSQCVIRVFSGDMTTERGVLYGGNSATTSTVGEWSTAQNGASLVPTTSTLPDTALSSVNALDGDVIVVEIGYRATNTVTTSYTGTAYVANMQNTLSYPDYPSSHNGAGSVGWIEFSQDLAFTGDYAFGDADDINVPVDLVATMSTPVGMSLAGSIDTEVDLVGTRTDFNRKKTLTEFKNRIVELAPWGYWPVEEGSGTTVADISGNGRNATLTGGSWVTETLSTSYGLQSVVFDNAIGNIRYTGTVPVATPATSGSGFTFMVISKNGVSTSATFEHGTNSGDAFRASGGATAYLYAGGTATTDRLTLVKPTLNVYSIQFYRFKTSDNSLTQFVAGQQVATRAVYTFSADGTYMGVGNTNATYDVAYQHFAYWDTALTDEQIAELGAVYLYEPVYLGLGGSISADVGLDADLTIGVPFAGEIIEETDLTGTISTEHPLGGAIDVEVGLAQTAAAPVVLAGTMDIDVSGEATLYITTFLALSGDLDIAFDLYGDSFEESFRAGTMDVPLGLDGSVTITTYVDPASALISLTGSTGADPSIYLILEPFTVMESFSARVTLGYMAPLLVPNVPESASVTNPATATGLVLRPMSGIIVDMATPTIEDGFPQ
jgi:hypothetical protein